MLTASRSVPYLCVLGLTALAGCGTHEYRTERKHCEAEWLLKIPPDYRQEAVTKYRSQVRPTGKTTCTKTGSMTTCEQVTETVSVPYTDVKTVDIRKQQRSPQIESCTARACAANYGNSKCEL